jgi:adenylate kinase
MTFLIQGLELDHVIELHADQKVLLDRNTTRAREAKEGGSVDRTDDNHQAPKVHLDAYNERTAPVIDYYRSRNVLRTIDGLQPVDVVTLELFGMIGDGS